MSNLKLEFHSLLYYEPILSGKFLKHRPSLIHYTSKIKIFKLILRFLRN